MFLILPIDYHQGEMLIQMRNIPTIHQRAGGRFARSDRVSGVDPFVGEFHRKLIILRKRGIFASGFSEKAVDALVKYPDRARAERRASALPECRA